MRSEDRFLSAKALAEDVEDWLADEPVTALPDPALARAARWARKHRAAVTSLVVLLATGLVTTTLGVVLINQERLKTARERDRAVGAEGKATANQARAEEGERKAKQSDAEARSVLTFFQDKILAAGRPEDQEGGLGPNVTLRKAIDKAEASIASEFAGQPSVEASVRDTLGQSYLYLVEPSRAIQQLEQAQTVRTETLGRDHPHTLSTRNNLAAAYLSTGRTEDATKLLEQVAECKKGGARPRPP